eukprot:scaffold584_cov132-Cylindrotheca_fusiformis.AAC.29
MNNSSWTHQVRRRLAEHLRNPTTAGSTDLRTTQLHRLNALETYFSPSRDRVARQAPSMVMPSNSLPPGHIVATKTMPGGLPSLLIHRDKTTELRTYLNQCRHRGSPLLLHDSEPVPMKSSALMCPYHGWTYDVMTGKLKRVPGEKEGFPCLDKEDHGLRIANDCFESAGAIWAANPALDEKNQELFPSIHSELSSLILQSSTDDQRDPANSARHGSVLGYRKWNINANWQLLVETFLESYHVKYLHNNTLALVSHSNVMVTDVLDDYSTRMTVPLKSFNVEHEVDPNQDDDSFWNETTTTYHLFPNSAISIFKRFILYLSIQPSSADPDEPSTSSIVQLWAVPRTFANDKERSLQKRDMESVVRGIEEDWECAEQIQEGLNSQKNCGGDQVMFSYGRFEGNNFNFLQNVSALSNK